MTEWTPSPNLSTDKDFEGETFAPIYTTTVTVSGGWRVTGGPRAGHARAMEPWISTCACPQNWEETARGRIPSSCSPPELPPVSTGR